MAQRKLCRLCGSELKVTNPYLVTCPICGANHKRPSAKTGKTDNQRKSQKQEKALAKEVSGRLTAASGATPFSKGDVIEGDFMYECKTTSKESYRIKSDDFNKYAGRTTKIPIYQIEFQNDGFTKSRLAVLRWQDFQFLAAQLPGKKNKDN